MNPRRIMAGRGLQNEVIRRTVYDGALRVEDEPYKIVKEAMADYCLGRGGESEIKPPTLNARPEWRKLLPLTGFIRPSVDTSLKSMTVTELMLSDESPSDEMADDMAIASVPSTVQLDKVPDTGVPRAGAVSVLLVRVWVPVVVTKLSAVSVCVLVIMESTLTDP